MTKNVNSTIRTDFNTLNIGELFTTMTLSDSSNCTKKDVSNYIFRMREAGCCKIHSKENGKSFNYEKIKDDTTTTRDSYSHKRKDKPDVSTIFNKYPNLDFVVDGTDTEIIDKLVPFTHKLKQMVMDLTDKVNELRDENNALSSDNATLRTEVDNYRIQVPRLQEEVMEFRKTRAIRTIKI